VTDPVTVLAGKDDVAAAVSKVDVICLQLPKFPSSLPCLLYAVSSTVT